jgi:sugar phosphate isomerase/epimerase
MDRRDFLCCSASLAAGLGLAEAPARAADRPPLFKISLAQWSLHSHFLDKKLDPTDFARIARQDYGIDAVEYVNQFYIDKGKDTKYWTDLRKRADDQGVRSLLIMCDKEGDLGDADAKKRQSAVENHHKWIDAAKVLGCHAIRVNAHSTGTAEEQLARCAEGLLKLTEYGARQEVSVIVENHGGLSSDGGWMTKLMKKVAHPRCGTLPDFGNFTDYDRYKGVKELMEYAKGVSAKSYDFDKDGNETTIDYRKMMQIVLDAGYRGYVGIEYEGKNLSEPDGVRATRKLLEKIRAEMTN